MSAHPLTHHEILGLVEPFTRRGRHLDLPASDRLARSLVFRPHELAAAGPGALAGLRETLRLENPAVDRYRLVRRLALPSGLEATLEAEGSHPAEILLRIEGIAPELQFRTGEGFVIAQSYRLDGADAARLVLTRAVAALAGLGVTLVAPLARGAPADIELQAAAGHAPLALPEDLLAVLGWDWGLLERLPQGWRSRVYLRGREPQRSRRAERAFAAMIGHLVQTLGEAPALFHARRAGARWAVAFRRLLPVLVGAGLIGGVALLPRLHIAADSAVRMLLFNLPPVLLVLVFCMREIPPFEIPRLPRASTRADWRESAAVD